MLFLGLDLSITGTGLVLLDNAYKIHDKTKLEVPVKGIERLYHLENLLMGFIEAKTKDREIVLACIEGPSYQSGEGQLFQIGEWTGIVKLNLFKLGIDFIVAAPSQLKKYIFGKFEKGTKKELVILDIYKKYGVEIRDNDIADAYVLARIARDYYNCYIPSNAVAIGSADLSRVSKANESLMKYQKEVLAKIHKTMKEDSNKSLL